MSHRDNKQAIVLVHGMGEQVPMASIRNFTESVWRNDHRLVDDPRGPCLWNKPSRISGSFEARRFTTNFTRANHEGDSRRCDFFEYYWAHQTVGTRWEHLAGWFGSLLLRKPSSYPRTIRHLWFLLWALVILVASALFVLVKFDLADYLAAGPSCRDLLSFEALLLLVAGGSILLARPLLTSFGDVARYVRAKPANIKVRQAIRQEGIDLLEALIESKRYQRIIVVGHSLGSIVAYDLLSHLWARRVDKLPTDFVGGPARDVLDRMAALAAHDNWQHRDQTEYRVLQAELFALMQQHLDDEASAWPISDFLSIGSPLTHAEFLIANNKDEFEALKAERQLPTCPPQLEQGAFYFSKPDGSEQLHHAALFAVTRWSNIYDPHYGTLFGDIISGPLGMHFSNAAQGVVNNCASDAAITKGEGLGEHAEQPSASNGLGTTQAYAIVDIAVQIERPNAWLPRLFTHTEYWRWRDSYQPERAPEHIQVLRQTLNLLDEPERPAQQ